METETEEKKYGKDVNDGKDDLNDILNSPEKTPDGTLHLGEDNIEVSIKFLFLQMEDVSNKKSKRSKNLVQKKNMDSFDDYKENEVQHPFKNFNKKNGNSNDSLHSDDVF